MRTRWLYGFCVLAAPHLAQAAASCMISPLPDWAANAIYSYPTAAQRPQMLKAALSERYDLSQIRDVNADALLDQLIPAMLTAADERQFKVQIDKAMAVFNCQNAPSAAVAGAPPAGNAVGRGAKGEDVKVPRVITSNPVVPGPPPASSMAATASVAPDRATQLKGYAAASRRGLDDLDKNLGEMQNLNTEQCKALHGSDWRYFHDCVAHRTQDLYDANRANYQVISDANKVANEAGATGDDVSTIKNYFIAAQQPTAMSDTLASARSARYGLYAGPSYSLRGNGAWTSGSEIVARFESDVHDADNWMCFAGVWCRTVSEFSYRTLTPVTPAAPATTNGANARLRTASALATDPAPAAEFDPFSASSGIFRYTGGYQLHFNDWFGVMGVAGLTALREEDAQNVRTKPRLGIGAHFQTFYGDGALGQLFFGYVDDFSWKRVIATDDPAKPKNEHNYARWVVDGLFFMPGVDLGGFQLAARVTADAPIDRRGPSDVRVSILLHKDLNGWLKSTADSTGN